jgi:hypothetical protein
MYNLDIPLAVVLKLSWQILQLASPIRFFMSLERKNGRKPSHNVEWTAKTSKYEPINKKACEDSTNIRHSTLLPWLQNGQEKTVSSLSIRFLGGGLAAAFRFPMVQLLLFLQKSVKCSGYNLPNDDTAYNSLIESLVAKNMPEESIGYHILMETAIIHMVNW